MAKKVFSNTLFIAIAALVLFGFAGSALASKAKVKELFPPSNDGSQVGTVEVEEIIDGVPQGRPYFIVSTPDDVDQSIVPLKVGDAVIFEVVPDQTGEPKKAKIVSKDTGELAETEIAGITMEDLGVASVRILPTSRWYFLKEWWRGIRRVFTFNKIAKADLELRITNEKAAELIKVQEIRPDDADALAKALANFTNNHEELKKRLAALEEISENPNVAELLQKVDEKTAAHTLLMDQIEQTVRKRPGRTKYANIIPAIQSARKKIQETVSAATPPPPPSAGCQLGWHEFVAGIDDQFALPTEPAIPSPGLQLSMNQPSKDFDEVSINKGFGHTFEDIAPDPTKGTIAEAFLEFRVKPLNDVNPGSQNDVVSIRFMGPDGTSIADGWHSYFGYYAEPNFFGDGWWWPNHQAELVELNLAILPNADGSTANLISELNAQDFLDLHIQDDTAIDYAKLRVRHYCPPLSITPEREEFCAEDVWQCGRWSACTPAGTQTRTCTLVTDCPGVETPKPAEEQSCKVPVIGLEQPVGPICTEDIWGCGRWSECSAAGTQTRTCTLGQDCPFAETPKPAESQTCVPLPPECAGENEQCGGGLSSCCEGLTCASSGAGYLACQEPPSDPPDLQIKKLDSAFHFGQSASYTIQVSNVGSGTATSPITITDDLPDGLTYVSFYSYPLSDWSCGASGQIVTCVYIGNDLSPGDSLPDLIINIAIANEKDFPATGDQIRNCATVEHPSDKNSGNDQSCLSTVITSR